MKRRIRILPWLWAASKAGHAGVIEVLLGASAARTNVPARTLGNAAAKLGQMAPAPVADPACRPSPPYIPRASR
jgi:hypothetical protein